MIELEISGDQFIRARKKAIDMGTIANSITNGGLLITLSYLPDVLQHMHQN